MPKKYDIWNLTTFLLFKVLLSGVGSYSRIVHIVMKAFFILFLISFLTIGEVSMVTDQYPWVLKKEKQGIRIFTRDIVGSNLKELKIEMNFLNTTIPQLLEVITNSNTYTDWVYKCSEANEVKEISKWEDISYYKFDFPWPFSDRDAYMKSVLSADEQMQSATIKTQIVSGFPPPEKDIVRMTSHFNQWKFSQVTPKKVSLVYYAKSNPAGNIPDWIVNLAVDRGPTETLSNLRELVTK